MVISPRPPTWKPNQQWTKQENIFFPPLHHVSDFSLLKDEIYPRVFLSVNMWGESSSVPCQLSKYDSIWVSRYSQNAVLEVFPPWRENKFCREHWTLHHGNGCQQLKSKNINLRVLSPHFPMSYTLAWMSPPRQRRDGKIFSSEQWRWAHQTSWVAVTQFFIFYFCIRFFAISNFC